MILKTKDHEIELVFKARKAQLFEEKVCVNEEDSILTLLPQKAIGKGKIEFMATLLNHFQVGNKKIPIVSEDEYDKNGNIVKEKSYDMYDFIDDWCEENKEKSISDLYYSIIEQFDISGIIDKGLGFKMVKLIKNAMTNMMEKAEEDMKM